MRGRHLCRRFTLFLPGWRQCFFYNKTQRSYFNRLYGATSWFLYPDCGNRRKRRPKRIATINPTETGTRERREEIADFQLKSHLEDIRV